MKTKFVLSIFAVAAVSGFFSCGKNDDDTPATKTNTDILTEKSWKLTKAETSLIAGTPAVDIIGLIETGCKDDLVTFKTDKSIAVDEKEVCSSGDVPFSSSDKWKFSSDEKTLIINDTTLIGIEALNDANLIVNYAAAGYSSIRGTFSHP